LLPISSGALPVFGLEIFALPLVRRALAGASLVTADVGLGEALPLFIRCGLGELHQTTVKRALHLRRAGSHLAERLAERLAIKVLRFQRTPYTFMSPSELLPLLSHNRDLGPKCRPSIFWDLSTKRFARMKQQRRIARRVDVQWWTGAVRATAARN
jgi:hypothetical protein